MRNLLRPMTRLAAGIRQRVGLKVNCAGEAECGCTGPAMTRGRRYRVQFSAEAEAKHITYEGRDTLVVPVVMARADVVMNGSWVPVEELIPETWNGVPVTVGHPEKDKGFTSANSPEVLTDWAVGRIFNAALDGLKLKAEAWIDMERATAVAPGLVPSLEAGLPMNISTGYFCDDEPAAGDLNGKTYTAISRKLRPDHLALLPDEEGACSWTDGCGVRTNSNYRLSHAVLSHEDRAALAFVRQRSSDRRQRLIGHVVANSAISRAQAKAMSLPILEIVAHGLSPSGVISEPANTASKAMLSGGVVQAILNRKGRQ